MDLARIGHIGAEAVVVGGVAYLLSQQNATLRTEVEDLRKQLQHVAIHTRNLHQDYDSRLTALSTELEKLKEIKKARKTPTRSREILRATAIDDLSPPTTQRRSIRLPVQETSSPSGVAGALGALDKLEATPPTSEDDDESDPESVLKRV